MIYADIEADPSRRDFFAKVAALLASPLAMGLCPAGVSAAVAPAAVNGEAPGPRYLTGDALVALEQALFAAVDKRKV